MEDDFTVLTFQDCIDDTDNKYQLYHNLVFKKLDRKEYLDYTLIEYYKNIDTLDNNKFETNESFDTIIYLDSKQYIDDLKKNGFYRSSPVKQFLLDCLRCNIYYNNYKISDPKSFASYIYLNYPEHADNIFMLTTQAIVAIPFMYICKKLRDEFNIIDLSFNDILDSQTWYCKLYIDIQKQDNKLVFNSKKFLKVITSNEDGDYYTVCVAYINMQYIYPLNGIYIDDIVLEIKYAWLNDMKSLANEKPLDISDSILK